MTEALKVANKDAPRLVSVDFVNGSKGSYVDIKFKPPLNGEKDVKYGVIKNRDRSTFKPMMVTEGPSVYSGRVDLGQDSGTQASYWLVAKQDDPETISDFSFFLSLNHTSLEYQVSIEV